MIEVRASSRVAAGLLARLCLPKLTPVAQAAARHERALYRVFMRAVREAQNAVPMQDLIDVLSLGHPGTGAPLYVLEPVIQMMLEETPRMIEHRPYVRAAADKKTVADVLSMTLNDGARVAAKPLGMTFDAANPEAIAWAERNAARLVTGVTEDVRDAIRLFVTRGFEEGIPPARLAQYIRDGIGLTPRGAEAVMNRRLDLLAEGLTQAEADAKAVAYAEKLIRSRALTIARTETMRASNEGQVQLWRQAEEKGLLTGTEQKVWITADPCPICAELDGETVGLNDDFSIGSDPPAHPNCRCTIGLV